jgi:lipopolysaccharide transport system ATP-binding protein
MRFKDPVLRVRDLGKAFSLYAHPIDRLKEALTGTIRHTPFQALQAISFELMPGESLGLIGTNGAGKSTLLKLIAGVLEADQGSVETRGRITGLLELGTGFDLEASGRENIAINARLIGLDDTAIRDITDQVIAFAELGPFIDMPVRSYSSGMTMRLGFSIAYHAHPAAFIVDEALSVGDARFQQKCFNKIKAFKEQGGALLFVSHDLNAIRLLCSRVLVLDQGRLVFDGPAEQAVQAYYRILSGMQDPQSPDLGLNQDVLQGATGYGHQQVRITSVQMHALDEAGVAGQTKPQQFASGSSVRIDIALESSIAYDASVGLLVRDRFGQDVFGVNSSMCQATLRLTPGEQATVSYSLQLNLAPGPYSITVAVHKDTTHHEDCQHWWDNALDFTIAGFGGQVFSGLVMLPFQCRIEPHERL